MSQAVRIITGKEGTEERHENQKKNKQENILNFVTLVTFQLVKFIHLRWQSPREQVLGDYQIFDFGEEPNLGGQLPLQIILVAPEFLEVGHLSDARWQGSTEGIVRNEELFKPGHVKKFGVLQRHVDTIVRQVKFLQLRCGADAGNVGNAIG